MNAWSSVSIIFVTDYYILRNTIPLFGSKIAPETFYAHIKYSKNIEERIIMQERLNELNGKEWKVFYKHLGCNKIS